VKVYAVTEGELEALSKVADGQDLRSWAELIFLIRSRVIADSELAPMLHRGYFQEASQDHL
jgi:hypothetical protein